MPVVVYLVGCFGGSLDRVELERENKNTKTQKHKNAAHAKN
jgi:hypothetical protein